MYGKDVEFRDPVVRCDSCGTLNLTAQLLKVGSCPGDGVKGCGCRKVRNVLNVSDAEREKMEGWGVDPTYLALFEPVEVVQ